MNFASSCGLGAGFGLSSPEEMRPAARNTTVAPRAPRIALFHCMAGPPAAPLRRADDSLAPAAAGAKCHLQRSGAWPCRCERAQRGGPADGLEARRLARGALGRRDLTSSCT